VVPAMAHGVEFFSAALVVWTYLRLRRTPPAEGARAAAACGVACGLAFLARSQDGLLVFLPGLRLALRPRGAAPRRGAGAARARPRRRLRGRGPAPARGLADRVRPAGSRAAGTAPRRGVHEPRPSAADRRPGRPARGAVRQPSPDAGRRGRPGLPGAAG